MYLILSLSCEALSLSPDVKPYLASPFLSFTFSFLHEKPHQGRKSCAIFNIAQHSSSSLVYTSLQLRILWWAPTYTSIQWHGGGGIYLTCPSIFGHVLYCFRPMDLNFTNRTQIEEISAKGDKCHLELRKFNCNLPTIVIAFFSTIPHHTSRGFTVCIVAKSYSNQHASYQKHSLIQILRQMKL